MEDSDFEWINARTADHCIVAKGLRMLYTPKIHDLIERYLKYEKKQKKFKLTKKKKKKADLKSKEIKQYLYVEQDSL